MDLLEPLTASNLQPFIDNPEQLVSQNEGFQIAVANYPETPRRLLEVLVNSSNAQIAEAAQLHVNWAGEMREGWQEAVDEMLPHRQLGQNDRLAVELLKIAPVPEYFLSEWVPAERLIQGLRNPYMPLRYRLKLLLRLAQEPTLEPRLQVAESNETPGAVLGELAGDLELPIRLAVKFNPSCPPQLIELVEGQHAAATDWSTDAEQLARLGQSRWAWVRLAVAQNPNAPAETLMQLATDALLKIQLAVAQNPGTPLSVLAVLAEHSEKGVQAAVVVHANASSEILHRLFPTQQHILRQQEDLPASILERFFNDAAIDTSIWKNSDLRHLLLRQANTPTWILAQLANVNLEALTDKLATHQPPPLPEILEQWIQKDIRFLADVAKHPQVSVEILERLAQYLNPWVQLAVARNLKTPAPLRLQMLSELIHNPELRIQVEIASDSNTPTSILEQLASAFPIVNLVDTIRQMLPNASNSLVDAIKTFITNHQSPGLILFELQQDAAMWRESILQRWRQLLANLTKSDRATLEALCRQMLPAIGVSGEAPSLPRWLNQYPYPSPEFTLYGLLLWFRLPGNRSYSENRVVSVALIGNPSTPAALLLQLQIQLTQPPDKAGNYCDDCDMRLAVAFNPHTSETQRFEYLQQALSSRWEDLAKNPNTPVSILEQIAQRGAGGIQSVANNPNAPVNILRQAAQQDNSYTLELVAKNPNTPLDLLKLVLNRGEKGVREAALKNPSLDRLTVYKIQLELQAQEETAKAHELLAHRADSPYALAQVLTSGDRNARMKAAGSYKTPIHVLEQLARDPDETVRQTVSQNSNLPLNSLLELVQDPALKVRISLLYTSHQKTPTPVQLLERLAQDESEEVRAKVAEHPDTPVELLARLASDSNRPVKASVVSNLKTPVTVLERLGLQENIFNVRNPNTPGNVLAQAVARLAPNPRSTTRRTVGCQSDKPLTDLIKFSAYTKGSQMPASVLSDLSYYGYGVVRSEVANHPNTPASVLERLGNDEWFPVRVGVAKHPNTPPHILELMARREDPNGEGNFYYSVCSHIAQRSDTPVSALAFLSNSHMVQIHRIVAGNSSTTLEVLAQMVARETDESVLESLARNPNLTSALLQLLAQKPYISVRILLIHHPNVTDEVWTLLTRDEDPIIRQAIAEDTDVPLDILQYLAQDTNSDVRSRLATNLNISPECLEVLAQDPDAGVRAAIASNSRTSEKILEQLAQDEKIEVRRAVAQNSNTPAPITEALRDLILQPATRQSNHILRGLSRLYNPNTDDLATVLSEYAQSDNAFVRFVTLLHPLTPREVLQQGARSQSWLERYAVADNPATPVESAAQLVQDSNRIVRATARAYL